MERIISDYLVRKKEIVADLILTHTVADANVADFLTGILKEHPNTGGGTSQDWIESLASGYLNRESVAGNNKLAIIAANINKNPVADARP